MSRQLCPTTTAHARLTGEELVKTMERSSVKPLVGLGKVKRNGRLHCVFSLLSCIGTAYNNYI